ncbi:hypothetical protein ACQ3G6_17465 [Allorhizobium undicola]|uniref:hypothetical protein n=1 Tax=Allorhizobium undicola TaxID=78527 RepID=UPI003D332432
MGEVHVQKLRRVHACPQCGAEALETDAKSQNKSRIFGVFVRRFACGAAFYASDSSEILSWESCPQPAILTAQLWNIECQGAQS